MEVNKHNPLPVISKGGTRIDHAGWNPLGLVELLSKTRTNARSASVIRRRGRRGRRSTRSRCSRIRRGRCRETRDLSRGQPGLNGGVLASRFIPVDFAHQRLSRRLLRMRCLLLRWLEMRVMVRIHVVVDRAATGETERAGYENDRQNKAKGAGHDFGVGEEYARRQCYA